MLKIFGELSFRLGDKRAQASEVGAIFSTELVSWLEQLPPALA
jgi:hypothetical protein